MYNSIYSYIVRTSVYTGITANQYQVPAVNSILRTIPGTLRVKSRDGRYVDVDKKITRNYRKAGFCKTYP